MAYDPRQAWLRDHQQVVRDEVARGVAQQLQAQEMTDLRDAGGIPNVIPRFDANGSCWVDSEDRREAMARMLGIMTTWVGDQRGHYQLQDTGPSVSTSPGTFALQDSRRSGSRADAVVETASGSVSTSSAQPPLDPNAVRVKQEEFGVDDDSGSNSAGEQSVKVATDNEDDLIKDSDSGHQSPATPDVTASPARRLHRMRIPAFPPTEPKKDEPEPQSTPDTEID